MKHKNLLASLFSAVRFQQIMNVFLILCLAMSIKFNFTLKEGVTVDVPPDLRTGAILKPGEKLPETVFAFSVTTFQSLHNWRDNGTDDYKKNADALKPFFTQNFYNQVISDFNTRRGNGELRGVTRSLALPSSFLFNTKSVKVVNSNTWIVKIPFEVREWVDGKLTKDIEAVFSFIVRRSRTNILKNAHQISIDSFYEGSIRTKDFLSLNPIKRNTQEVVNAL